MIKIIYAADNLKQYELLSRSIESLIFNNAPNEVSFIFMFKQNLKDKLEILINKYNKLGYQTEYLIISEEKSNEISERAAGMLFWTLAPLVFEGEKYLQLDNDTIININLNDFFAQNNKKFQKNVICGSRTLVLFNSDIRKKIRLIHGKKGTKKILKYVNYGVLMINGYEYRKIFDTVDKVTEYIKKTVDISKKMRIVETDQEIFFNIFKNKTGILKNKYNLRIHRSFLLEKTLKNSDYILHYNLYIPGIRKFDFNNFIFNKEIEEKEKIESLKDFYFRNRKFTQKKSELIDVIGDVILHKNK